MRDGVEDIAYRMDALSSNSMKSANPHSGFHRIEVAPTLDTSDCNPLKNQGGGNDRMRTEINNTARMGGVSALRPRRRQVEGAARVPEAAGRKRLRPLGGGRHVHVDDSGPAHRRALRGV